MHRNTVWFQNNSRRPAGAGNGFFFRRLRHGQQFRREQHFRHRRRARFFPIMPKTRTCRVPAPFPLLEAVGSAQAGVCIPGCGLVHH